MHGARFFTVALRPSRGHRFFGRQARSYGPMPRPAERLCRPTNKTSVLALGARPRTTVGVAAAESLVTVIQAIAHLGPPAAPVIRSLQFPVTIAAMNRLCCR
jgi:hypothetical protein